MTQVLNPLMYLLGNELINRLPSISHDRYSIVVNNLTPAISRITKV